MSIFGHLFWYCCDVDGHLSQLQKRVLINLPFSPFHPIPFPARLRNSKLSVPPVLERASTSSLVLSDCRTTIYALVSIFWCGPTYFFLSVFFSAASCPFGARVDSHNRPYPADATHICAVQHVSNLTHDAKTPAHRPPREPRGGRPPTAIAWTCRR